MSIHPKPAISIEELERETPNYSAIEMRDWFGPRYELSTNPMCDLLDRRIIFRCKEMGNCEGIVSNIFNIIYISIYLLTRHSQKSTQSSRSQRTKKKCNHQCPKSRDTRSSSSTARRKSRTGAATRLMIMVTLSSYLLNGLTKTEN